MKKQSQVRTVALEPLGWLKAGNSPHSESSKSRVPSVYLLKSRFQAGLSPIVRRLAEHGITANQVTVFASLLSVSFGIVLTWRGATRKLFLLLPFVLIVRMALNAMDGMLAKDFNQKSDLGVYLNELGDVVADVFLFWPFAVLPSLNERWMTAAILLAVVAEMAGVMAAMIGASRRYDGPMGKSDRAVVFGALGLWLGIGYRLPPSIAYWFPRIMCLLLLVTVVNRVRNGLKEKESVHG